MKQFYLDLLKRIELLEKPFIKKTINVESYLKLKNSDKLFIDKAIETLNNKELSQGNFLINIGYSKRNYPKAKLLKKFIGIFWITENGTRKSTVYKTI